MGDLAGVGLVWHYPEGVANMLSQFRMIVHSKWKVYHSADKFHESGNINDLGFDVETPQGFRCKFTPTPQGLHVYHVNKDCKGKIFGGAKVDDKLLHVGSCHAIMQEAYDVVQITGVNYMRTSQSDNDADYDSAKVSASDNNADFDSSGVVVDNDNQVDEVEKRVRLSMMH